MFSKILVPVDLSRLDPLEKALSVAADMARHHRAAIIYLGVTEQTPGPVAHNPGEFATKLDAFAAGQAAAHGIAATGLCVVSHDPAAEIDRIILKQCGECGADLVVIASHPPRLQDWLLPSHGGHVAEHADISVLVVR